MRKILFLFFILVFGFQNVSSQTYLERKLEYYKKEQVIQNQRIMDEKVMPYHLKKLEKWNYDVSKFNFEKLEDKKQFVLLFDYKKKKNALLGLGIAFNVIGTSFMGLGGSVIYNTRNDREGFGGALGAMAISFGTLFNIGSIPMYITSHKKHKRYLALKQSMEKFKEF